MVMSSDVDKKLFAAVLCPITEMWGDTMEDLQRMSLANQIVREIERRNIFVAVDAVAAEREACAIIAESASGDLDCDDRGAQDWETGEVPCRAESRGEPCVCAEIVTAAGGIADRIRKRT